MRLARWGLTVSCSFLFACATPRPVAVDREPSTEKQTCATPFKVVLHVGTGTLMQTQVKATIESVLRHATERLQQGGTSLDTVEAAVAELEDSGHFNSGKGAARTVDNKIQLDASIMDGRTLAAGSVGALSHFKNPVHVARAVLNTKTTVLLVSVGAEAFAKKRGMETVDDTYFQEAELEEGAHRFGTVGVLALDTCGHLAAATSTGGLKNKLPGRVGDTGVIGAGTYADDRSAAVSATGIGEYFIRFAVASRVAHKIEFGGLSAEAAVQEGLAQVTDHRGDGGVIALTAKGDLAIHASNFMVGAWVGNDLKINWYDYLTNDDPYRK